MPRLPFRLHTSQMVNISLFKLIRKVLFLLSWHSALRFRAKNNLWAQKYTLYLCVNSTLCYAFKKSVFYELRSFSQKTAWDKVERRNEVHEKAFANKYRMFLLVDHSKSSDESAILRLECLKNFLHNSIPVKKMISGNYIVCIMIRPTIQKRWKTYFWIFFLI